MTLGMKINKDLTAAAAGPLVLKILKKEESYGYDIMKTVHLLSENRWEWTEGMLYPILHRLEKQGYTESFWKAAPTGRKRKYYRITVAGNEALDELDRQWDLISGIYDKASENMED